MATVTRRASQNITLLIVMLAAITALTLDYHGEANRGIDKVRSGVADVLAPIQRGISKVLRPIGDVASGALHYQSTQEDIEQLQHQVAALSRTGAESSYLLEQSEQVMALAHLRDAAGVPTIVAPVLLGPSSNFEQTIEIGLGTSSGVGQGMPVEDADGLVGSVTSAGTTTATVLLLTDERTSVAVRFGNSGTAGITVPVLSGQGAGRPLATTISTSGLSGVAVHVGETVLTSGLAGAAYPAGIPVGTVRSVTQTTGGLAEQVAVAPYVTPSQLQFVAVMLWTPTA